MNKEINVSNKKDKRHTNKPYTEEGWKAFRQRCIVFNNQELARYYNVSIRTIYHWRSEARKIFNDNGIFQNQKIIKWNKKLNRFVSSKVI